MRGPSPTALLERAILASARAHGVPLTFNLTNATCWESATFSGARHILHAHAATTASIDTWLSTLPEADLPLHGHLVADLAVVAATHDGAAHRLTLEALTVVC